MDSETRKFINRIKEEFGNKTTVIIPAQRNRSFTATLKEDGISVDNLGKQQPFLPWKVFVETINLLTDKGGVAIRGDAMGPKLGSEKLPIDSVEGHIAITVYGQNMGDTVFRRITPVASILVWAGICENLPGKLALRMPKGQK